ncbi:isochorismatase [Spiroplasma endosymbiont of Polydrusus formosus]|uniref:isochorismatase n=1 Tax=Spiroplasma endosymbiont of Polydrusus formosus TaxID=3139326 RepID=UPI0035B5314E
MNKKALIVVDYKNDFVDHNGALYVLGTEKLYSKIVELIITFHNNDYLVIATKDFNPDNHCLFTKWKPYCIANTVRLAVEFYKLTVDRFDHIILKVTKQEVHSYSGFLVMIKPPIGYMSFYKSIMLLILLLLVLLLIFMFHQPLLIKLN